MQAGGTTRVSRALLTAGCAGAAAFLLLLVGEPLERLFGLRVLFALRDPRPAPAEVLVVNIDAALAGRLGLPRDTGRWPRALHADLVRSLAAAGAGVIAFDMDFERPQPGEDERFAAALREAGNVVLFSRVELGGVVPGPGGAGVRLERVVTPAPALEAAAAATAPFTLPKVPARVDRSWSFKAGAGDAPSLPVAALAVRAREAWGGIARSIAAADPQAGRALADGPVAGLAALREIARREPARLARWRREAGRPPPSAEHDRLARALFDAVGAGDAPFLDFYGPAGTFRTLPFDAVARGGATGLRGAAVFVGYAEHAGPEQPDAFLTVFSRPDGVDLSGVEIAATAYANLLEGRHPHPPPRPLVLAAGALGGALLGGACGLAGSGLSLAIAAGAAAAWLALAAAVFAASALWLPVVIPAAIVPVLASACAFLLRYAEARRERQALAGALGEYLPAEAVAQAVAGLEPGTLGSTVHAVCLCTDVEGYTTLSERLDPVALRELMNRYFATLIAEVRGRGGVVSNLLGDAMLAVWVTPGPHAGSAAEACRAALAIAGSVPAGDRLPTRAAVHAGAIALGSLGAAGHFEYAPIGDIVNTTARLESLGKKLGVRVLASGVVAALQAGLPTRPLGRFLLAGKMLPVEVVELIGGGDTRPPGLDEAFAAALGAWRAGALTEAERLFAACAMMAAQDGPAAFYGRLCSEMRERGEEIGADGVVRIESK